MHVHRGTWRHTCSCQAWPFRASLTCTTSVLSRHHRSINLSKTMLCYYIYIYIDYRRRSKKQAQISLLLLVKIPERHLHLILSITSNIHILIPQTIHTIPIYKNKEIIHAHLSPSTYPLSYKLHPSYSEQQKSVNPSDNVLLFLLYSQDASEHTAQSLHGDCRSYIHINYDHVRAFYSIAADYVLGPQHTAQHSPQGMICSRERSCVIGAHHMKGSTTHVLVWRRAQIIHTHNSLFLQTTTARRRTTSRTFILHS